MSVEEIVERLKAVSDCKTNEELIDFACTLSVASGTTGDNRFFVEKGVEGIANGVLPCELVSWAQLLGMPVYDISAAA